MRSGVWGVGLLGVAFGAVSGADLHGQGAAESARFISACTRGVAGAESLCAQAASGALGLGLGLSLLSTGGALTAAPPNTLGRRLPGGKPRVAFALRVQRATLHSVAVAADPARSVSTTGAGWGVRLGATAGLFDGFRPVPSVGGVLSVDAFANLERVLPASTVGVDGAWALSGGLRIGLLRESFTAPGIGLDLGYARTGDVELSGDAGVSAATTGASTRSARLTLGKDLMGLGFAGGVGRDWLSLPTRFAVGSRDESTLDLARNVVFGALTWNRLVVQLTGELGWATGSDLDFSTPVARTEEGTFFASFTSRLVF